MKNTLKSKLVSAAPALLVLLVSACGGGSDDTQLSEQSANQSTVASGSEAGSISLATEALLAEGAELNAATLSDAESASLAAAPLSSSTDLEELTAEQVVPKSAYSSGVVVQKAAASLVPVWRFFNSATGAHFFTRSATERDNVKATLAPPKGSFNYEGEAFKVASVLSPGLAPVHRFYNTQIGVHFYTISDSERANIVATLPHFSYEGIAYYASQVSGTGMTPLYRFYVPSKGFHFYTASLQERNSIRASQAATYTYEGVSSYVLASDWVPQPEPPALIPHSGKTDTQCVGIDSLGNSRSCSDPNAVALNPQQDGHRATINPMSYSTVGAYPIKSCVKDNLTGLIWEGKPDDGPRRSHGFTSQNNNKDNDTSGYVAYVNGLKLCGYSDWRLPTLQDLLGIMNYGKYTPTIDSAWFPNTNDYTYWAADRLGTDTRYAATVTYNGGYTGFSRVVDSRVRLVRGYGHSTQRYIYDSVPYGADATNNVVIDGWTGLRWRRCEEGRTWTGSTCSGTGYAFSAYSALEYARDQPGWRLPNVKEMASLLDLSVPNGATIDSTTFPGAAADAVWTSTPRTFGTGRHYVDFDSGRVSNTNHYSYTNSKLVRLVQLTP
jgi:hypothetical protein